MSNSFDTFGGNINRGEAFFFLDRQNSKIVTFPKNDLGNPIETAQNWVMACPVFGRDTIVGLIYSTTPRVNLFKSFANIAPAANVPVSLLEPGAAAYTNNYPLQIGFGNGMFMATTYRSSAVPGHIFTSLDGNSWTKYSDVVPAGSNYLSAPTYNSDNGRWAFTGFTNSNIYYSDDDGATWSTATAPVACRNVAYGNGRWVFSAGSQGAVVSSDNLSSFTQVSPGGVGWNISYNPHSQRFWSPSGSFDGSVYRARIFYSVDGTTWTTSYAGSYQMLGLEIAGDDDGNLVCVGQDYSGGAYNATTNYLYSTDNGVSWNEGTLPTATKMTVFGQQQMTYASLDIGTPPAGTPPLPTYSILADRTEANEGDTITWTINTTSIPDGTTLYYSLLVDPFDGYSDFTDNLYSGSFAINGNSATIQKTVTADSVTEGTETVVVQIRSGSVSGTILVESDPVTIYDTSVYVPPPPPAQAQPTITAGASQSFSVPRSVYKNETIEYSVQFTNSTPYNYTVDVKQVGDFYGTISDGDVRYTFELGANTVATQIITETFPKGYTAADAPNWNQTLAADARGAPGTPNTYTINVSRTPYNINISPPSGSSYSVPATINIAVTGAEPNSYLSYSGSTNGSVQFDGSGSYTFANLSPANQQPQTYSWTMTLSDGTSFPYTLYFTN